MKNKKILFAGSGILILLMFIFAANFYKNYENERIGFLAHENSSIFVRDYSPQYGDEKAKVFLIEFLDPECESCRKFYPLIKNILKEYEGKVQLIVRYAPFHHNSKIAIRALEASRNQGKYWEALEVLFKYQPIWGSHHNPRPNLIFDYLAEIGLDIERVKLEMNDPKIEKMINQEVSDLKKLNVRATPTFFVNGKPLKKFGLDYLREAIKSEVEELY